LIEPDVMFSFYHDRETSSITLTPRGRDDREGRLYGSGLRVANVKPAAVPLAKMLLAIYLPLTIAYGHTSLTAKILHTLAWQDRTVLLKHRILGWTSQNSARYFSRTVQKVVAHWCKERKEGFLCVRFCGSMCVGTR
jgi:hypothetical protein